MKVYAHRGSSIAWPENTLMAFRLACEAGATGLETDLRLASDGEIVLSHDASLDRLGHPGVVVSGTSSAALCRLEVRSPDGAMHDRMTTLRALLETHPSMDYIFDCKVDDRELFGRLRSLLAGLGFHDRIRFLTWSRTADAAVSALMPGYLRFPSYRRSALWGFASTLRLGRIAEPGSRLLSLPAHHKGMKVFSPRQIRSIHARGKIFMGYLVNTLDEFDRCMECGVREVLTDRPDLICPLAARG